MTDYKDRTEFKSDDDIDRTEPVDLSKEVKGSFLAYAMSVLVARALPDVRDGLKPVHRRIIYGMNDQDFTYKNPHKKSAKIVGDVMGKYHPHGDSSIYGALVRLAQPFNTRYLLVDGHGNFGSIDGDGAAAMRYTEARLSKIANELVRDIKKDTVNFIPTYDGEDQEPEVLPSRIPNLLINGSDGIAVGMATKVPPHNLGEVIDGTLALIENPELTTTELMQYIPGPDFPTGGTILGKTGIKNAYETGRGSIVIRSKYEIEETESGKPRIVVYEIPYGVNKAEMIERIASLVKDKIVDGITDLRDETNKEGIRVVIELRKDVVPEVILNQLFKYSQLQTSFGANLVALVDNTPMVLSLKEILQCYINHQIDVITRRSKFDLDKAADRLHILEGLSIAARDIDKIIETIKTSKTNELAQQNLMEKFQLSERQAKAVLEMQLQRLTGIQQEKLQLEINDIHKNVEELNKILSDRGELMNLIKRDLQEIKDKYGDERRTDFSDDSSTIEDEELIPKEDIIITLTHNGYVKRVNVDTYRSQNRGGKGIKGITTADNDVVENMLVTTTHTDILFFTNLGKVYRLRGYQIPEYSRQGKGLPIVNKLALEDNEKVRAVIDADEYGDNHNLIFITKQGVVKRVNIAEFENIRQSGKIALSLREGDELFDVKHTSGNDEIYIAASTGKCVRFNEQDVRIMGRNAAGVMGIDIAEGTNVVGATTSKEGNLILAVTTKGYGKMSDREDYRLTKRGGKGVVTVNVTEKNGNLVALRAVNGNEDLLITTTKGTVIRLPLSQVKIAGRNTQGVRIINLDEKHEIASIAVTEHEEEIVEEENSKAAIETNENQN